jgi:hypothetical protein
MNRRKAMRMAAGAIAAGGAGVYTLSNAFEPTLKPQQAPYKLVSKDPLTTWRYAALDPAISMDLAYKKYDTGSCMYAAFISIALQLAEKFGEPYASFPFHMMKYGHGGVGGFGTICGALNGAAALIGLFIADKKIQDSLIADLFRWYENSKLPEYKPEKPTMDFQPPSSVAASTLCHASTTNWGKVSGYEIKTNERKERCRRLTADVAGKITIALNRFNDNAYITGSENQEVVETCMTCHGSEGKLGNTGGKMNCTSCHTESVAHKAFADIHYKVMKEH